jgi:hypothetical protein
VVGWLMDRETIRKNNAEIGKSVLTYPMTVCICQAATNKKIVSGKSHCNRRYTDLLIRVCVDIWVGYPRKVDSLFVEHLPRFNAVGPTASIRELNASNSGYSA